MSFRTFSLVLCLCAAVSAQGPLARKRSGATTAAAPSGNAMSAAQKANVEKLKADLAALQSKSQVTPEMKQQLSADLMAMADGATKPSQATVDKLAADLAAALADKTLSQKEIMQLTSDLQAVLTSANVPMSEFTAVVNDVQAILTASHVSKTDVQVIIADLQAIYAELQKNVSNGAASASGAKLRRAAH